MSTDSKIRAIVVDDERPARRKILRFLKTEPDVEVVGEAGNGHEAIETIQREKPDLIFLDIQMPGLDGFDVVEAIDVQPLPQIVFVTAYDQFALRAFEVHALDYLLKPFDVKRFQSVLERTREHLVSRSSSVNEQLSKLLDEIRSTSRFAERLMINHGERAFLLPIDQIDWIEAAKNYVSLCVGKDTHLLRGTLDGLCRKLDPKKFVRVNRSHVIRADFIKELQPWFHGEYRIILKNGKEIMWTRRYLDRTADLFIRKF